MSQYFNGTFRAIFEQRTPQSYFCTGPAAPGGVGKAGGAARASFGTPWGSEKAGDRDPGGWGSLALSVGLSPSPCLCGWRRG